MKQLNEKASPTSVSSIGWKPSATIYMKNASTLSKLYCIDCCGTGHVIMNDARLNVMFEKMPTLRFLLMRHPKLKAEEIKQHEGGVVGILHTPEELGVSKSSFTLLVGCIYGHVQLPVLVVPDLAILSLWRPLLRWEGARI
jgi:hypothetical protein